MQITIPSIVRAIQERPRGEWEDEEEEVQEPAAVLVNHIATKRIEHIERKRQMQEQREEKHVKKRTKAEELMRQIHFCAKALPVDSIKTANSRNNFFIISS